MFFLFLTIVLVSALLSWLYIFDTYEIKYKVEFIDKNSMVVSGVPLNVFGNNVPFRKIESSFRIIDGVKGVYLSASISDETIIIWDEKNTAGIIKVGAKNSLTSRENVITIPINLSEEI